MKLLIMQFSPNIQTIYVKISMEQSLS